MSAKQSMKRMRRERRRTGKEILRVVRVEKSYTANVYEQAHRAARGEAPPPPANSLTDKEMLAAIQLANSRLEPKRALPAPMGRAKTTGRRATEHNRAHSSNVDSVQISEQEILAALAEAQAAGRSTITAEQLGAMISEQTALHREQRGYVKWL